MDKILPLRAVSDGNSVKSPCKIEFESLAINESLNMKISDSVLLRLFLIDSGLCNISRAPRCSVFDGIQISTLKVALCAIFIVKFGLYLLYISKDCHK